MANVQKRLVLTGALFGASRTIGNWRFEGGVCDINVDATQLQGVLNMVRFWGAYEQGTQDYFEGLQVTYRLLKDDGRDQALGLASRIEEELKKHGYSAIPEAEVARPSDGVFGHLFPTQQGDSKVAGVSELLEPDQATQGAAGSDPVANSRPEVPAEGSAEAPVPAAAGRIKEALAMIDPSDDELWTREGDPKISAIEDFYDGNDLTRKLVNDVWPEFDRELARTLHGDKREQATG